MPWQPLPWHLILYSQCFQVLKVCSNFDFYSNLCRISPAWRKAFAKSLRWIVVFLIDVVEKPKILTSFKQRRSRVFGNQQLYGRGTCYHLHRPPGWKENYKNWRGGKTTRYKLYPNQLNGLKSKKPHCIKTKPVFSETFQTEGCEPFDFPPRISGYPMYTVNGK